MASLMINGKPYPVRHSEWEKLTSFDRKWIRLAKEVLERTNGTHPSGMSHSEARETLSQFGIYVPA